MILDNTLSPLHQKADLLSNLLFQTRNQPILNFTIQNQLIISLLFKIVDMTLNIKMVLQKHLGLIDQISQIIRFF